MSFRIAGIVLVAFIATAVATDDVWDGLVASWDLDTSTRFYNLPKTLEAALNEGWANISGVNPADGITALGFEDDPTVVLLFEDSEVIGLQVAFLVEDVDPDQPVQWDELDSVIQKTLNDESYYTATFHFQHNDIGKRNQIWTGGKTDLHEIPTNVSLLSSETDYSLKNCVPTMGTHYYQLNSTTDCATMNPWFLLTRDEYVIGIGFQSFGQLTTIGSREWWERIPSNGSYISISDPPTCAADAVEELGLSSLHIWFVDGPQNITCS